MKKIDKFWYWFLCVIAFVICFMFGYTFKANASNFTLADGTISNIKYDEPSQVLSNGVGANIKTLTIKQTINGFIFIINTSNALEVYSQCTRTDNTFNCTYWTNIPITSNKTEKTWNSSFTITLTSVKKDTWTNYMIQKTYDEGVADGLASGSANYEQGFTDGQNSVDITTDNQNAIDSYIANNKMKTEAEYLNYGETKYQEGKDSVDITSDNQQVINSYIAANNMKTEAEYLLYGETKYQEGKDSVDITLDNQSYANQYIIDNDYKTYTEYLNYGEQKYIAGVTYANNTLFTDSISYTSGYDRGYIVGYDIGIIDGFNNADITSDNQEAINKYISDNNMKTEFDYLLYGNQKYNEGVSSVDITSDNQEYTNQYIINNNYHDHEEYLNYGEQQKQDGINSIDVTSNDAEVYKDAFIEGEKTGYEKANEDGKILGSFVPNLLGGIGSFFLTILNIDILGFNLLSVIGIFITILGVIIVIKFLKG